LLPGVFREDNVRPLGALAGCGAGVLCVILIPAPLRIITVAVTVIAATWRS
jgi:hypothetical protein